MDHEESPGITANSCDIRPNASAIDEENGQILVQERRSINTLLNRRRDPSILRLPVEIASRIFLLYHSFDPLNCCDEFADFDPRPPIRLASVCHDWKSIAHSTPGLWNTIAIRLKRNNTQHSPEMVRKWLDRAAALRLHILLETDNKLSHRTSYRSTISQVIDVLNTFSSQWSTLVVGLPFYHLKEFRCHTAPPLDFISITTFNDDGSNAKFDPGVIISPSALYLYGTGITGISIDWTNLINFHTSNPDWQAFFAVLKQAPHLQFASFGSLTENQAAAPETYIVHHHLRKLEVFEDSGQIWPFLTIPSLEILAATAATRLFYAGFKPFLLRSGCRLKDLRIEGHLLQTSDLLAILSMDSMDDLKRLDLGKVELPPAFFQSMAATANADACPEKRILPNLYSLRYEVQSTDFYPFDWDSLMLVLNARSILDGCPLRKVSIHFGEVMSEFQLDEDMMKQMLPLQASGMEISLLREDPCCDMLQEAQELFDPDWTGGLIEESD